MKTKFTRKRFLSIFLVLLILGAGIVMMVSTDTYSSRVGVNRIEELERLFTNMDGLDTSGGSFQDTSWISEHLIAITIGGMKYDSTKAPVDYQEGTNISARFDWKISDGMQLPEKYEYSLGDFKLKADYKGGTLCNQNGQRIGEWTVVRDTVDGEDKLVFTFLPNFQSEYAGERYFWVQLDGTIPLDPPGTGNSDKNRFQIGDGWLDLIPKYQQGEVDLSKEMKDLRIDSNGNVLYTANITATVKGYIRNLVLFDQLNQGVNPPAASRYYLMDDLTVQVNGKNLDHAKYSVVDYSTVTDARRNQPWGFELAFNDMVFNAGDKITVTYTFKMMYQVLNAPTGFPEYNSIGAEYVDIPTSDKKTTPPKEAPLKLDDLKLTLNKSGERDPIYPSLIKWTLTIDTGIAVPTGTSAPSNDNGSSPIRQALIGLLRKKYPGLNLYDVLGKGHDFTDSNIKSYNGNSAYFLGGFLTNTTISKLAISNNKLVIVCEYTTQIENVAGISEYTNTATLRDNTTNIVTSGPVGLPVYTLDKTAINADPTVNKENGEVTMPWQIVTRIPGPGFGSYTIVDNPENDNTYNKGYTHRYKKDSVKVYIADKLNNKGSPLSDLPQWLKFEEYNNGFKLTITENKDFVHKYLFLVFDTEVVDANGKNVNFTDKNYQFKNNASIEGKNIEDSDTYAPISNEFDGPSIAKGAMTNVVEEETGDYIFTWLVSVNNIPVAARNSGDWTESWKDVFSVELEDTIPNGHVFEKGSLVATLYKGSGTSISTKNVISSVSIPNISEWLSKNLQYEYNDGSKVKFMWTKLDGQCQYLKELEELSTATTEKYYLAFEYKTRLVEHATLVNGNTTFKNSVGGKVNDKDVIGANASAQVKPGNFGAKSYAYQSDWISADYPGESDWMYTVDENGSINPNMRFTIEINQPALTLSTTDKGTVYLEDTMGVDLRLIEESVRLYNTSTKEYVNNPSFKYSDNKLTMEVPGGVHYTLTYWVEVCGDVGGTVSSSKHGNKVKLTLGGVSKEFTKNPSGKKYGSAGGSHAVLNYALPKTGGKGIYPFYIFGAGLVLSVGIFTFITCRKKRT